MRAAAFSLLCLALGLVLTGPDALAGTNPPPGAPSQQTHPAVRPGVGGPHTRFGLAFTIANTPGHDAVTQISYTIQVGVPRGRSAARCAPARAPRVPDYVLSGQRVHVALATPLHGWCTGRYTVTMLLVESPYCPPPVTGAGPVMCPLFATQPRQVGVAHFSVR